MLRKLLGMAIVTAGLGLGGANPAAACHRCELVKVTSYRTELQPLVKWVTVVDDYGCKHRVKKVYYVPVEIPVVKWVKVCH